MIGYKPELAVRDMGATARRCNRKLSKPGSPAVAPFKMHFTYSIESNLEGVFARLLAQVSEQAVTQAAEHIRHRLLDQFLSEGSAYGQKWLPRKRETRHTQGRPLLVRTGRLRASFTELLHPEHVEQTEITPARTITLTIGSRVPYATFHQTGTANLPRRTILTPAMLSGLQLNFQTSLAG